ncbi:hypothetical protein OPV22_023212 [Ensete ventricosum]|uniref:Ribulose bisphosphate carboxylase small subunit n=1 Tax=Ensete ventricosum TaxID=4639 RepID=A0AAV8QU84_ENSVE|nr:hypothetical protein OPV22_023212 [Ensete ventricosum]
MVSSVMLSSAATTNAALSHLPSNGGRVQCMEVWPIEGKKKFETLSYLPTLVDEALVKQIEYLLRSKWIPCLEFSHDGFVWRENPQSPGYYDERRRIAGHHRRLLWHQMPKSTPRNHSKTTGICVLIHLMQMDKHTACLRTTGPKARLGTHGRLLRCHPMASASVNSEKEEDIYLDLITQYEKCGTCRVRGPKQGRRFGR